MSEKTVFISYSHDSAEHRGKVLALSERLRDDGLETRLDQYVNGSPEQGWPRWMLDQLDHPSLPFGTRISAADNPTATCDLPD